MTLQEALEVAGNIPPHYLVNGDEEVYQKVVEALAKLHTYYEMRGGEKGTGTIANQTQKLREGVSRVL